MIINCSVISAQNTNDGIPQILSFTASFYTVQAGDSVTFTVSASDPDGSIVLYELDINNNGNYDVSSTSSIISAVMPVTGSFIPRIRVTDSDGNAVVRDLMQPIVVNTRTGGINRMEFIDYAGHGGSSDWSSPLTSFYAPDGSPKTLVVYVTPGSYPHSVTRIAMSPDAPGDPWNYQDIGPGIPELKSPTYHDDPAVVVDEDGYIHVWLGVHNLPWKYYVSNSPYTIEDGFEDRGAKLVVPEGTSGHNGYALPTNWEDLYNGDINSFDEYCAGDYDDVELEYYKSEYLPGSYLSYIRPFKDSNGRIYITSRGRDTDWTRYRDSNRDGVWDDLRSVEAYGSFATYDVNTRTWVYPLDTGTYYNNRGMLVNVSGQVFRDPSYTIGKHGVGVDSTGRIHIFIVWGNEGHPDRGTGDDGKDLSYAYSDDLGLTWYRSNGVQYSLPIDHASAEIIVPVGQQAWSTITPLIAPNDDVHIFFSESSRSDSRYFHMILNHNTSIWSEEYDSGSSWLSAGIKSDGTFLIPYYFGNSYGVSTDGGFGWTSNNWDLDGHIVNYVGSGYHVIYLDRDSYRFFDKEHFLLFGDWRDDEGLGDACYMRGEYTNETSMAPLRRRELWFTVSDIDNTENESMDDTIENETTEDFENETIDDVNDTIENSTENDVSNETNSSVDVPVTNSATGGGGGGSSKYKSSSTPVTETKELVTGLIVLELSDINISINNEIVTKITLFPRKNLENFDFSANRLSGKPEELSDLGLDVYSYISLEKRGFIDEDLEKAEIFFRVRNDWLNNYKKETLRLYRYNGVIWDGLETNEINSDEEFVYYKAISKGFSVFAIGAEKVKSETEFVKESGNYKISKKGVLSLIGLILLITFFVIFLKRKLLARN